MLKKLPEVLGIDEGDFYIMSHENAFFQYVMHQDEQLRNNSVAMFKYDDEGMVYYRIDRKNQGNTTIYYLRSEKIPEITYPMLFEDVEKLDLEFAKIATKKMRENVGSGKNIQMVCSR